MATGSVPHFTDTDIFDELATQCERGEELAQKLHKMSAAVHNRASWPFQFAQRRSAWPPSPIFEPGDQTINAFG